MKYPGIKGTGSAFPPVVVKNSDFEKFLNTSDEWIKTRTGISERRFVHNGTPSSRLAIEASKLAIERAGIDPSLVDLIVVGTITPDMFFPSTACILQRELELKNAWGFDISAACSGFVYALAVASQFIATERSRCSLVIGVDVMSSILDFQDRNTAILFGDGAGAVVLGTTEEGFGIIDMLMSVDGEGGQYLYMPAGGSRRPASHVTVERKMHFVHQDGKPVFKWAVMEMGRVVEELLDRNKLSPDDIGLFIPHQANIRIIQSFAEKFSIDWGKIALNIDMKGNTTAGTIPTCLDEAVVSRRIKRGDLVMLISVGAGYTSGGILIRWG